MFVRVARINVYWIHINYALISSLNLKTLTCKLFREIGSFTSRSSIYYHGHRRIVFKRSLATSFTLHYDLLMMRSRTKITLVIVVASYTVALSHLLHVLGDIGCVNSIVLSCEVKSASLRLLHLIFHEILLVCSYLALGSLSFNLRNALIKVVIIHHLVAIC